MRVARAAVEQDTEAPSTSGRGSSPAGSGAAGGAAGAGAGAAAGGAADVRLPPLFLGATEQLGPVAGARLDGLATAAEAAAGSSASSNGSGRGQRQQQQQQEEEEEEEELVDERIKRAATTAELLALARAEGDAFRPRDASQALYALAELRRRAGGGGGGGASSSGRSSSSDSGSSSNSSSNNGTSSSISLNTTSSSSNNHSSSNSNSSSDGVGSGPPSPAAAVLAASQQEQQQQQQQQQQRPEGPPTDGSADSSAADTECLALLSAIAARHADDLDAWGVALSIWALGRLGHHDDALLTALCRRGAAVLRDFKPVDCAQALAGWARLRPPRARAQRAFVDALAAHTLDQLSGAVGGWKPSELATVAWALSRGVGSGASGASGGAGSGSSAAAAATAASAGPAARRALLGTLMDVAQWRLDDFGPGDLAVLVSAYARLHCRMPAALARIAAKLAPLPPGGGGGGRARGGGGGGRAHHAKARAPLEPRDAAMLLWGFSRLGFRPAGPLLERLAATVAARADEFAPRELAAALYALGLLRCPHAGALEAAARAAAARAGDMSAQELTMVLWAFGVLRYAPPEPGSSGGGGDGRSGSGGTPAAAAEGQQQQQQADGESSSASGSGRRQQQQQEGPDVYDAACNALLARGRAAPLLPGQAAVAVRALARAGRAPPPGFLDAVADVARERLLLFRPVELCHLLTGLAAFDHGDAALAEAVVARAAALLHAPAPAAGAAGGAAGAGGAGAAGAARPAVPKTVVDQLVAAAHRLGVWPQALIDAAVMRGVIVRYPDAPPPASPLASGDHGDGDGDDDGPGGPGGDGGGTWRQQPLQQQQQQQQQAAEEEDAGSEQQPQRAPPAALSMWGRAGAAPRAPGGGQAEAQQQQQQPQQQLPSQQQPQPAWHPSRRAARVINDGVDGGRFRAVSAAAAAAAAASEAARLASSEPAATSSLDSA